MNRLLMSMLIVYEALEEQMQVERVLIPSQAGHIPAVVIAPPEPKGAVVLAHGYGGCKEEQMGFGWRMAETGFAVCVIDWRGHGENPRELDINIGDDVNAAVEYCRRYGKVAAVGHSIGGRAVLTSSADYVSGLSPGLPRQYGRQTHLALRNLRCHRVRPHSLDVLLNALDTMPVWQPNSSKPALIVYGSRDLIEIVDAGRTLKAAGGPAVEVEGALHMDIYLTEIVFAIVNDKLREWFGRSDLSD